MNLRLLAIVLTALVLASAVGYWGCTTLYPPEEKQPLTEAQLKSARTVAKGNNAFAIDLYRCLGREPGNLFFSPFSVQTALAMTYVGARGKTEDEMATVLYFSLPQNELHPAFAALIQQSRSGPKSGYSLRIANALWPSTAVNVRSEFQQMLKEHYGAKPTALDFENETESARRTINEWTAEKTEAKIPELLDEGILTPETVMVLTNAIYFKGDWARQFKTERTRESRFTVSKDKEVLVPMMYQEGEFRYRRTAEYQVLELPYVGEEVSMLIVLPNVDTGLSQLEDQLSPELFADTSSRKSPVRVSLPKWNMKSSFGLEKVLPEMGMPTAFQPGEADFRDVGNGATFIAAVIHKAVIEVAEEGTEVAVATAVSRDKDGGPYRGPNFRADHPFLFVIRENLTGAILFMGRVVDPS